MSTQPAPTREQRDAARIKRKLQTCIHWNGIFGEPACAKGIDLPHHVGPARVATGWGNAIPCIPNADPAFTCTHKATHSVEEIEAQEAKDRADFATTLAVMKVIPPGGKGSRGEVPCPKCGGTVRWMRSSYNGHLSGSCPTGCVAFMQ
jgi:hypothetical protein